MNLKMVRAGILRRGDEGDCLRRLRVAHVNDRKAIGEHVPDIRIALMDDDLDTIQAAALVAARQKADILGASS